LRLGAGLVPFFSAPLQKRGPKSGKAVLVPRPEALQEAQKLGIEKREPEGTSTAATGEKELSFEEMMNLAMRIDAEVRHREPEREKDLHSGQRNAHTARL
jgi:hypothetical protein